MTDIDKSNYNFLQDTPKQIIDSLYNELQGEIINYKIRMISSIFYSDDTVKNVKEATSAVFQDSNINRRQRPANYITKSNKIKAKVPPSKKPVETIWKKLQEWFL